MQCPKQRRPAAVACPLAMPGFFHCASPASLCCSCTGCSSQCWRCFLCPTCSSCCSNALAEVLLSAHPSYQRRKQNVLMNWKVLDQKTWPVSQRVAMYLCGTCGTQIPFSAREQQTPSPLSKGTTLLYCEILTMTING